MHLAGLIGIGHGAEIDISRPLVLLEREFGSEAASEAARLIDLGGYRQLVSISPKSDFPEPFYWSIMRQGSPVGEIFAFPSTGRVRASHPSSSEISLMEDAMKVEYSARLRRALTLPTSLEIALIRAIDCCDAAMRDSIMNGYHIVAIGDPNDLSKIISLMRKIRPPASSESVLWQKFTNMNLVIDSDKELTHTTIECISGSFVASPLKFRFIELYRIIENRFLRAVLEKLNDGFFMQPGAVLAEASKSVQAEVNQFVELSKIEPVFFESVYHEIDQLSISGNTLASALFRKLGQSNYSNPQSTAGAVLMYYLRCAIVHAGGKDIIFESYRDGEFLLEKVIMPFEEAALFLAGIKLSS